MPMYEKLYQLPKYYTMFASKMFILIFCRFFFFGGGQLPSLPSPLASNAYVQHSKVASFVDSDFSCFLVDLRKLWAKFES